MGKANSSEPKTQNGNDYLGQAKYLWEEYKYRHELIWRLIFQFTTALVLISIIPYIQVDIVACLRYLIVVIPFLATVLACFGILVMMNELELFGIIKVKYRELQNDLFKERLHDPPKKDELNLWKTIKSEIQKLFSLLLHSRKISEEKKTDDKYSSFKQFVLLYFIALSGLSFVNLIFIVLYWIPKLPCCNLR